MIFKRKRKLVPGAELHGETRRAIKTKRFYLVQVRQILVVRRREHNDEGHAPQRNKGLGMLEMPLHPAHLEGATVGRDQGELRLLVGHEVHHPTHFHGPAIELNGQRVDRGVFAQHLTIGLKCLRCGCLNFEYSGVCNACYGAHSPTLSVVLSSAAAVP